MKICVINGSPKGKYSVTVHTSLYLERMFPSCEFKYINAAQRIEYFTTNFAEAKVIIQWADLIVFSYPVYTFLAPSQLHKFIRLMKENSLNLQGKYCTQISTSKHFYDVTAHKYIEQNCYDLGLKYIQGLSADMDDLTLTSGQRDAEMFFNYVLNSVENDIYEIPFIVPENTINYKCRSDFQKELRPKEKKFNTIILTDVAEGEKDLVSMIKDFKNIYPYETTVVNIKDYPFKGGCIGCFNCAADGKCFYKDGFDQFLRNKIQKADSIVYAFSIKDHSMGHLFKCYDDRQFCNGHRMVTIGMPIGYIINGNYSLEENLKLVINGRNEVGHTYLAGIGTAYDSIKLMSEKLVYSLNNHYYLPENFLGVGGTKIFRDLIYIMRGLMKADHKFYKEQGVYDDLPTKHKGRMVFMMIIGSLSSNKRIRSKMGNKMNEAIIAPYRKAIDNVRVKD